MYRKQRESQGLNYKPSNDAKVSLVSEEEANVDGMNRVMSIDAIPDMTLLSSLVVDFVEFYGDSEVKKVRDSDYSKYLNMMFDKFEKLPMSMIKLLSDEENQVQNLQKIIDLLETLSKVKSGEVNIESARDEFIEKQNESYFYPAFGGKDKLMQDIKDKGGDI
jgi:esterase/lipase